MSNIERQPIAGDVVIAKDDGVIGTVSWVERNSVYVNFDDCSYATYTILRYKDAYNFYDKCEFVEQKIK